MAKWLTHQNLKTDAMFCTIPMNAAIIAARQGYLNVTYHLSTWKGGGMGMFAGADSGNLQRQSHNIGAFVPPVTPVIVTRTSSLRLSRHESKYETLSTSLGCT